MSLRTIQNKFRSNRSASLEVIRVLKFDHYRHLAGAHVNFSTNKNKFLEIFSLTTKEKRFINTSIFSKHLNLMSISSETILLCQLFYNKPKQNKPKQKVDNMKLKYFR